MVFIKIAFVWKQATSLVYNDVTLIYLNLIGKNRKVSFGASEYLRKYDAFFRSSFQL